MNHLLEGVKHYMPKQETRNKQMLLHCKSKGRTTASQCTQEAPTSFLNYLPETVKWKKKKRKKGDSSCLLHPSLLITFLRQDNKVIQIQRFLPSNFQAPHLSHICTFLPRIFPALLLLSHPLCLLHCTLLQLLCCLLLLTFFLHQTLTNFLPQILLPCFLLLLIASLLISATS